MKTPSGWNQGPANTVPPSSKFEYWPLPIPTPSGRLRPVAAFGLQARDGSLTQFPNPLQLTINYDLADLDGTDPTTLAVYTLPPAPREVLSCQVDTARLTLMCDVWHFTEFEIATIDIPTPTPRPAARMKSYLPLISRQAGP